MEKNIFTIDIAMNRQIKSYSVWRAADVTLNVNYFFHFFDIYIAGSQSNFLTKNHVFKIFTSFQFWKAKHFLFVFISLMLLFFFLLIIKLRYVYRFVFAKNDQAKASNQTLFLDAKIIFIALRLTIIGKRNSKNQKKQKMFNASKTENF